jgi:hypothetical protein
VSEIRRWDLPADEAEEHLLGDWVIYEDHEIITTALRAALQKRDQEMAELRHDLSEMSRLCWIRLSCDTLPREGSTVLCFWPSEDGYHEIATAVFEQHVFRNPENEDDEYVEPTHWMRLPPIPPGI